MLVGFGGECTYSGPAGGSGCPDAAELVNRGEVVVATSEARCGLRSQ